MATRYSIYDAATALLQSEIDTLTVSAVVQMTGWRGPSKARRAAAALTAAGYWRRYATSTLPPRTVDGSFVYDRRAP